MKAARIASFGNADALLIVDIDKPTMARTSDVLVRVIASGVNAIEWKIRSGAMAQALGRPLLAKIHKTIKTTPAMEAGVTTYLWEMGHCDDDGDKLGFSLLPLINFHFSWLTNMRY